MTARPARLGDRATGLRLVQGTVRPRPRAGSWIVFALLAVFVFFAPIVSRTSLDRAAFELREIRQSISEETARFEELELEVARLSSPSRIAPLADALGMVLPTEVVRVEAPRIVRNQTDREERWAEMKSILTASP